jgi:hypothetical protein
MLPAGALAVNDAAMALWTCEVAGHGGGAQLHLRVSAADLAHALITGTGELDEGARHRILVALLRLGPIDCATAAYVTALHWAQVVSSDLQPPSPIVFRSLGRDADWLAALEFVLSVLAAFDGRSPAWARRGRLGLPSLRR